jgi:hypothetical protein
LKKNKSVFDLTIDSFWKFCDSRGILLLPDYNEFFHLLSCFRGSVAVLFSDVALQRQSSKSFVTEFAFDFVWNKRNQNERIPIVNFSYLHGENDGYTVLSSI